MSGVPDTPAWRELRRLAAIEGVEDMALRRPRSNGRGPAASCFVDLSWRGGEVESVRLDDRGDPDDLARAVARELGLPLGSLPGSRPS